MTHDARDAVRVGGLERVGHRARNHESGRVRVQPFPRFCEQLGLP